MSSLYKTNFGCASVREKSITYENNDSCKQRLVIDGHFILNMISALKVLFSLSLTHLFVINHPETANCCNFSLSLPLWVTLGKNCLVSVQRDCNLE